MKGLRPLISAAILYSPVLWLGKDLIYEGIETGEATWLL